jgi:hypothetical protein
MGMDINVLNVVDVPALDLAFWISANLLDVKIPQVDANSTVSIQGDLLPVLSAVAQRQIVATELYNVVVAVVPSQTSVKSSEDGPTLKEIAHELNKKKDMLYRTIQTLESARETASRLMTGLTGPRT